MKISDKVVLLIAIAYLIFHFLIIIDLLPKNIVFRGKITSYKTILFLEFFAFFVMLFLGYLILIKNNIIQCKWKKINL